MRHIVNYLWEVIKRKKVLLSVIITVCVMTGIGYGVIMNVCQNYEETIADMTELYEDSEAEIAELEADKAELSDEVFNMMNDEPYSITIYHDGETHTYAAEDNKGFIRDAFHSIIK